MIGKLIAVCGLAGAIALSAPAQVPSYTTLNSSGTSTSVVYFATGPDRQVRIVGAVASSDLAAARMSFTTGTTPLSITKSNAAGTTIDVARTNGFTVGDFVLVEKATGVITNAMIASFTGATNIVFANNVPQTLVGDQIYKMSSAVTLWVGVFTNRAYMGEAVYVGNRGRPVQVIVNGTSACSLDSVTGRYE